MKDDRSLELDQQLGIHSSASLDNTVVGIDIFSKNIASVLQIMRY